MAVINISFLESIVSILQKGWDQTHTFDAIFELLDHTVSFDSATLYIYNHTKQKLDVIHQTGDEIVDLAREIDFDKGKGLSGFITNQKEPVILPSLGKTRSGKENRFRSFVSMPLWDGDKLLGVLNLGHRSSEIYKYEDLDQFKVVSAQLALVIQKMIMQSELDLERKRLKEALTNLKHTQSQLIEKERVAAIGQIVITINHEINNPLTSIIGLTELTQLLLDQEKHESLIKNLDKILHEAFRIKELIQKISEIDSSESMQYVGELKMTKIS